MENIKTNLEKDKLTDITFLIPLRIDSIVRLENLLASIECIRCHFITNIFILESSSYNNQILKRLLSKEEDIHYFFVEDRDPIFYRTFYLNYLTQRVLTDFIAIWDADIILHHNQIIEAVEALRNGYDVAFPYDGYFYDTTDIIRELYLTTKDENILFEHIKKMPLPYGHHTTGGAIFLNRESYIRGGMENEKFYGWAPEDVERHERWKNLNYKIFRSKGPLFHLTHPRDLNGTYNSSLQKRTGFYALSVTKNSAAEEIYASIKPNKEKYGK